MLFLATYPFSAELEPPMSLLQFVDSMFGRLAWPLVVLVIAFMLRRQLAALASRVLELSFGGATVKFGDLLTKGTDIVDEMPDEPGPIRPKVEELAEALREQFSRVQQEKDTQTRETFENVEESLGRILQGRAAEYTPDVPSRNVFAAFQWVENTLNKAGIALGIRARGMSVMQALYRRELVTKDDVALYGSLREARNAIAHGEAELPNDAEAMEYDRQVTFLLARLMTAMDTIESENRARDEERDPPRK
jgi:hypothetical protein